MSQKVRYLSRLFRNINMEPHENMQKGSVKVSGTCSKSQNLASCTCSVKICVTNECKNICVTHESETSIWKHMKIRRIRSINLETHENLFFLFGMNTSECRIHVEKLMN